MIDWIIQLAVLVGPLAAAIIIGVVLMVAFLGIGIIVGSFWFGRHYRGT